MSKLRSVIFGVFLGFVLAHFVNQSPTGREFFARINRAGKEIADAIAAGYNEAE